MALDAIFGDQYGFTTRYGSLETGFRYWKSGCAYFVKMMRKKKESQDVFYGFVW